MPPTSDDPFAQLGLHSELLSAVQSAGFQTPTPIQSAVIAAVLAGKDVLARAATGSGKTAAFGLPLLQRLLDEPRVPRARGNPVAVLVLAPTRELVMQIADVLSGFTRAWPRAVRVKAVYGGVAINPQMMALRGGVDILVATPGRLLDLQRKNAVELSQLRALVLDEADRMLSLGFRDELDQVIACLPARRQNLLFSATLPPDIATLTQSLLHDPIEVDVTQPTVSQSEPNIEQRVYSVDVERKPALLIRLLEQPALQQVLVFISMKKTADTLVAKLERAGIHAAVFHADKSQRERSLALQKFRDGSLRVLLATDLAARGIDIDDLPVVINFELPRSPNDYLHRIGRTGRAGKTGLAISLVCSAEEQHFRVIEKRMKRKLPREQVAGFESRT
ncbi:MAG TPA: DEAD/DEAH box helicase [Polyangiales bacterium]|nr:DEAD/DEAH box helicase [Polyangiales bacterium]